MKPSLYVPLATGLLLTLAFITSPVRAADPLPWTKGITFWTALPELEKQCAGQGGTSKRLCYNKSNDTFLTWTSAGCTNGFTPALWCKAPATAPAATTTAKPTPTPVPPTGGAATQTNTAGGVTQTNAAGGATQTNTAGGVTQTNTAGGNSIETLKNPLKFNSLTELMDGILQAVVQLGAILLVFMLVWVGFLFVMARGNPEEISKARSALVWTLIGGLILLGAEAISQVIQATVQTL